MRTIIMPIWQILIGMWMIIMLIWMIPLVMRTISMLGWTIPLRCGRLACRFGRFPYGVDD